MEDVHILSDMAQVKALTHPLRQKILESMACEARTPMQVAEHLGEKPTKLYHHVEILSKVGLITLVRTRRNRGTVEHYYRAVARKFAISRQLFRSLPRGRDAMGELGSMFERAFEITLREIRQGLKAKADSPAPKPGTVMLSRQHVRGTPEELERLRARIEQMLSEIQPAGSSGEVEYGLTVAFYPVKPRGRPRGKK